MRKTWLIRNAVFLAVVGPSMQCAASLIEETLELPVDVVTTRGDRINAKIPVTVFRDDSKTDIPFVIIQHGRVASREAREKMGRVRYEQIARHLASAGYAVFIPTRMGYGPNAENDVEDVDWKPNACEDRDFDSHLAAGVAQAAAVLELARGQPYVSPDRGVLVGNSQGAMITLKFASRNPAGIRGVVNFSGGVGGANERPANPCNPSGIARLFSEAGREIRVPALWFYSENDLYWGPTLPLEWLKRYEQGGGRAQFVKLPPLGENGHVSFTANMDAWKTEFGKFASESTAR